MAAISPLTTGFKDKNDVVHLFRDCPEIGGTVFIVKPFHAFENDEQATHCEQCVKRYKTHPGINPQRQAIAACA